MLEVADDGAGFDAAAPSVGWAGGPGPTGFGLAGMRERAELLGGQPRPGRRAQGRGTTVRLTIPFLPAAQSGG